MSSHYSIANIEIKGFRGFPKENSFNLPLDGKSLILFGENGAGKSSIIDSIEYFFTGSISYLKFQGGDKCIPNVTNSKKDISIQIDLKHNGSQCDVKSVSPQIKKYISEGRYIIRRTELLNFILSQPSARYEIIEPFLKIDDYNFFLKNLDNSIKIYDKKKKDTDQLLTNYKNDFSIFKLDDISEVNLLRDINLELEKNGYNQIINLSDSVFLLDKIRASDTLATKYSYLKAVFEGISKLIRLLPTEYMIEDTKKSYLLYFEESTKTDKFFNIDFYQHGLTWIADLLASNDSINCPLCNSNINGNLVIDFIKSKIEMNKFYSDTKVAYFDKYNKIFNFAIVFDTIRDLIDNNTNFSSFSGKQFDMLTNALIDLEAVLKEFHVINTNNACMKVVFDNYIDKNYISIFESIKSEIEKVLNSYDKSSIDVLSNLIQKLTALNKFDIYFREQSENAQIAKRINHLKYLQSKAIETRRLFINNYFQNITNKIASIYDIFHNNNDKHLGMLKIEADKNKNSSVDLYTLIKDNDYDVKGLYSEGHQDTLGLAIYFALREYDLNEYPEFTILIIDDVISSVDATHRRFITEYIVKNIIGKYQLILTTHDRFWFKQIKEMVQHSKHQNYVIFKEINKITPETGPMLSDYQSDIEFILNPSNNLDCRLKSALCFAESYFLFLCKKFELSVKLSKFSDPTLNDTWSSLFNKLSKLCYFKNKDCINNLNNYIFIRNIVDHARLETDMLTDVDKKYFMDNLSELYKLMACPVCGDREIEITEKKNLHCLKCDWISNDSNPAQM